MINSLKDKVKFCLYKKYPNLQRRVYCIKQYNNIHTKSKKILYLFTILHLIKYEKRKDEEIKLNKFIVNPFTEQDAGYDESNEDIYLTFTGNDDFMIERNEIVKKNISSVKSGKSKFSFAFGGQIACGYSQWINDFCKQKNIHKILFLSRDMSSVYKIYNKYNKEYDNSYVIVSREALLQLSVKEFPIDYYNLIIEPKFICNNTLGDLIENCNLDINKDLLRKYNLRKDKKIKLSTKKRFKELFDDNIEIIANSFLNKMQAARDYYKGLINDAKIVCIVDIGWNGSNIKYLNELLVHKWKICDKVYGTVIGCSNNEATNALIDKGLLTPFAYSYNQNESILSKNVIESEYLNITLIETIFSTCEKHLQTYNENHKSKEEPFIFSENERNSQYNKEFEEGILLFADEFYKDQKRKNKFISIGAYEAIESIAKISTEYDFINYSLGDYLQESGLKIKYKIREIQNIRSRQ